MRYQMQAVQAPRSHDFPEGFMQTSMSDSTGMDPILAVGPR